MCVFGAQEGTTGIKEGRDPGVEWSSSRPHVGMYEKTEKVYVLRTTVVTDVSREVFPTLVRGGAYAYKNLGEDERCCHVPIDKQ